MEVKPDQIFCVVPVYNNKDTLRGVALECRKYLSNVFVVDDGSTDCDVAALLKDSGIPVVRHATNRGKGQAIMTALRYANEKGAVYLITIDGDGQHYPKDIVRFLPLLKEDKPLIAVGVRNFEGSENVPVRSKFGRDFSNFWFKVETGLDLGDCQSGFRAYPVKYLCRLTYCGLYYDFEAEVLVRAAWSGIKLVNVAIDVWYPPCTERVSSFRPFMDNFRFTLMHIRLVARRLVPIPYKRLVASGPAEKFDFKLLLNPLPLAKDLLKENATPMGLAISTAAGVVVGALPIFSAHTLVIIYVTARLHLNKVMAVLAQNICIPPVVPVLCIEVGHYLLHKGWLFEFTFEIAVKQLPQRAWEWFLGSLIVGPLLAIPCALAVYAGARYVKRKDEFR